MKRAFSILLLCLLFSLCGCQYTVDVLDRGTETEGVEELLTDDMEVNYAMEDGTTIDPETLVDSDGAVVRILGIHNTTECPEIELAFDKGNREYVDFIIDYVKIDGWQVSGGAGPHSDTWVLSFISMSRYYKEFTGIITIFTTPLVECGLLDQIHEIEFGYQLVGPSGEGIIAEGVYSTTTSNEGEAISYICDGPVLLESDDIEIQLYSFEHGTYLGEDCEDLILYIENDSDRRIMVVIDGAEKYEEDDEEDEEEEEAEEVDRNVIARNEKDGKIVTSVPLHGEGNVCAGSKTLGFLQTADEGEVSALSENEILSFTLSVYDYEAYNSDEPSSPLLERNMTMTVEGLIETG
ncbi:MAG: hypothetical protein LUD72_00980 [Bacteroidales bacterium]|nr:hypothetical protein [Bacteroidales bacterium]